MADPQGVDEKVSPTTAFNATHTRITTIELYSGLFIDQATVSAPNPNDAQCLFYLEDVAKKMPKAVEVVCMPLQESGETFRGECKPVGEGFDDANGERCKGEYTQPGKQPQKFMFTPNRPP